MNVEEIVVKWLTANGYDGLVAGDGECGCEMCDLIPCDAPCGSCEPAYRGPDPSGETEWLMYARKEAVKAAKKKVPNERE